MTDKELGTAAGDIFTTQIAKAIQAKTGGNVEGKLPEWWAEFIGMVLAELHSNGRLIPAGGMALTAEQVEDVEALVAAANPYSAPAARLRTLFPATEPAEPAASEGVNCGANSVVLGWCTLSAQHEGLHTNGTYFWGQALAPAEPAEETKAEPSTRQIADVIVEGRSQNMSWMQIAEMVKQVFFPTETGPWQDWPSLDAVPADVRTVWDKSGDEYRRENGGWKFRSHGGDWQNITLPLADYDNYASFTTATVAVWDPELGTRNDWTLNEGTEK